MYFNYFLLSCYLVYALLSGGDIWINLLAQKRCTVHIDECDVWNDLRPFLKYLVQPFSSKLRSMEAKGLKRGNLGKQNFLKYQLFMRFNFLFMYHGRFPPTSRLKLRFLLFEPEKVSNAAGILNPFQVATFSGLKRTNLNFRLLLGGNWP